MQRAVDTEDFRSLQEAKRLIDGAFQGGTAWFPSELSDLHGASSALARVIAGLRKETRIRAVARRLAAAMSPEDRARMDREHPDVPERIRHITDWGKVDRGVAGPDGGAAEGKADRAGGAAIKMYPSWDERGRLVWTTDAAKSKGQINERIRRRVREAG